MKEFENKKVQMLFGSARELIKIDWKKQINEKLYTFYISLIDFGTGTTQKLPFGINTVFELNKNITTSDSICKFLSQNIPR
jgi:hypothetical protein